MYRIYQPWLCWAIDILSIRSCIADTLCMSYGLFILYFMQQSWMWWYLDILYIICSISFICPHMVTMIFARCKKKKTSTPLPNRGNIPKKVSPSNLEYCKRNIAGWKSCWWWAGALLGCCRWCMVMVMMVMIMMRVMVMILSIIMGVMMMMMISGLRWCMHANFISGTVHRDARGNQALRTFRPNSNWMRVAWWPGRRFHLYLHLWHHLQFGLNMYACTKKKSGSLFLP